MPVVKFQGDRISFPDSMSGDEISDVLGALWASTQAVGEFAAMIGTSSIAEPLAGIAGAGSALFSPSQGAGGRTVQSVRDALTYRPRTRAGQLAMQSIAKDVSHLSQATGAEHLSGYWKDRVVPALQENFGVISGSALAAVGLGLIGAFAEMSPGRLAPPVRQIGAVGDLENILSGWRAQGVDISVSEGKRGITVGKIIVPDRGQGVGSAVMKDISDFADKTGQTIKLDPSGDFGGNVKRLKKFYKSQGFVENKGKNRDFTISEDMFREPIAPVEPSKSFKGKVFHQTDSDFSEFDFDQGADGTIWFTDKLSNFNDPSSSSGAASGGSRVIESDVVLNKVAGFDDLDKFSVGELIQQGFDGAVLDGDIQVFDPGAIKSLK